MDKRKAEYRQIQKLLGDAVQSLAGSASTAPEWRPEVVLERGYVAGYHTGYAAAVGEAAVLLSGVMQTLHGDD